MVDNRQQNSGNKHERRDFLKYILGGGAVAFAAAILYPLISYLKPPKVIEVQVSSVKVGKVNEIPNDSGILFKFGNKPGILVRTASGEFRAFEATCTHLDCTVQFKKDMGVIWCACHNGKYDLNGRNISGPPPRPLNPFKVIVQGEDVFVSKIS
jgi:Rieske Fe-S protein